MKLKPIFRIVGTKTGTSLIDACVLLRGYLHGDLRLVEPFCGSASVSIAVDAEKCLLADLQPHAILTLQVLRGKPLGLLAAFDSLRNIFLENPSSEAFYSIRDNPPKTAVDRAAWFIFITHAAFNWLWRVNSRGKCNTTFGAEAGIRRVKTALDRRNALALVSWLSSENKEIVLADAFDTISSCGTGDLIYVDPPYVEQFDSYTRTKFRNTGHIRLCKALRDAWMRGAQVCLHCNADRKIAALYTSFCTVMLRSVRRVVAGSKLAGKGDNDWEMLIVSQPQQATLFPPNRPENSSWFGGTAKPVWNEHESLWETWTPLPAFNLSLF